MSSEKPSFSQLQNENNNQFNLAYIKQFFSCVKYTLETGYMKINYNLIIHCLVACLLDGINVRTKRESVGKLI